MKKYKLSWFVVLKYFLISLIVLSLGVSIYWDVCWHQNMKLQERRNQFAFKDLLALEETDGVLSNVKLEEYLRYFQDVLARQGSSADIQAMMGFCYFHLGQKEKARGAYEQALILSPKYFPFHYNLAVIDFQEQNYSQALEGFQRALTIRWADNALFLRNSKNFVYIVYKVGGLDSAFVGQRLKQGYGLSAYFAAQCLEHLGNDPQARFFYQQSQSLGMLEKNALPRLRLF